MQKKSRLVWNLEIEGVFMYTNHVVFENLLKLTFGTHVFNFKTNGGKTHIHNKNKDIINLKI